MSRRKSTFRVIITGFFSLIITGTILLSMPFATVSGTRAPFLDALFTSTSAACVTGLIVYDTAAYWSLFGQLVILILIQIGGLGIITVATYCLIISGQKIGLFQRIAMQDQISAPKVGGIIRFTKFFIETTFVIEAVGALLLFPSFLKYHETGRALFYSVFHSVSAFCNAGFDVAGTEGRFASLSAYAGDAGINLVIIVLIVVGGLGFLTWYDLVHVRFRIKAASVQTKMILAGTCILIAVPFLYFFFYEFRSVPLNDRFIVALFQTVTPRTAGFSTVDYGALSDSGLLITTALMLIGGAPGSTAGGMKVTTIFILAISSYSFLVRKDNVNCFKRRVKSDNIRNAVCLFTMYLLLLFTGSVIMSCVEGLPALSTLFECASALGTVGLTTGITPQLSSISKVILILFMFMGRVGGVTIAYAIVSPIKHDLSRLPSESIALG